MKRIFLTCGVVFSACNVAQGLEGFGLEGEKYTVSGTTFSTSKYGLNIGQDPFLADPSKNIFPTDSYSVLLATMSLDGVIFKSTHSLGFGIGGAVGGLMYDSTTFVNKPDGKHYSGASPYFDTGYGNGYAGAYGGFYFEKAQDYQKNAHNYTWHTAYLHYAFENDNNLYSLRVGRFNTGTDNNSDFLTSYMQGVSTYYKYKSENFTVKPYFIASFGRSFAYGQWLYDWYATTTVYKDGKPYFGGIYITGAEFNFGKFSINPFHYYSPSIVSAPGVKIQYNTGKGAEDRLISDTKLWILSTFYSKDFPSVRNGIAVEKSGNYIIHLMEQLDYNNYNAGVGLYKLVGNAHARFGWSNRTIPFDYYDQTIYNSASAINAMLYKDAITGYAFLGSTHKFSPATLYLQLLYRYTNSQVMSDNAFYINGDLYFNNNITFGLKLEYFAEKVNANYSLGSFVSGAVAKVSDRSAIFGYITYSFAH